MKTTIITLITLAFLVGCSTPSTFTKTGTDLKIENAGYKKTTKTAPDGTVTVTEAVVPLKDTSAGPGVWQGILTGIGSWFTP